VHPPDWVTAWNTVTGLEFPSYYFTTVQNRLAFAQLEAVVSSSKPGDPVHPAYQPVPD